MRWMGLWLCRQEVYKFVGALQYPPVSDPDKPTGQEREPLPTPGDAFFKETFSHLESARNFFEQHLPERARKSDWSCLKREPETFLDANLRSRFADMLFSCR